LEGGHPRTIPPKFGGNRTKDVEVGPDRWTDERTDRPIPIYLPPSPQTMFAGGITTEPPIHTFNLNLWLAIHWNSMKLMYSLEEQKNCEEIIHTINNIII
jgi:hypothetical protein